MEKVQESIPVKPSCLTVLKVSWIKPFSGIIVGHRGKRIPRNDEKDAILPKKSPIHIAQARAYV
jgi:hypothetical protein